MSGNWDVVWDQCPPLSADGDGSWDGFCHLWDDCILIIGGAGKPPEEAWNAYKGLSKKKKKKVIKLIVWLKDEIFEEEKPIEDYDITIEDIKMILNEYNRMKKVKNINVSNITME